MSTCCPTPQREDGWMKNAQRMHKECMNDERSSDKRKVRVLMSYKARTVAGATYRPLIFRSLPAPHRTCPTAPRPRHLSPTPQLPCLCRVKCCQCHVSVMPRQRHDSAMPHALRSRQSSATPLSRKVLCISGRFHGLPAFSLCFSAYASHGLFLDRSPV
jgi:hypothetical protein